MTYKGVYRDGIVIIQGDVGLRNGSIVDVNLRAQTKQPARTSGARKPKASRDIDSLFKQNSWDQLHRNKMNKKERMAILLASRGVWKDRPEWKGKSSAEISTELRIQASRRGRNA